jgi:hypothetical protein
MIIIIILLYVQISRVPSSLEAIEAKIFTLLSSHTCYMSNPSHLVLIYCQYHY